ncbi:hypothetical protein Tco_1146108 [Tanacetum coccineum]
MIDIFNVPNYIGFKDLFAQIYSGSPTIQSDDSFPSSSPMKTSDSTLEEFTNEFTLPNSLPPGDDNDKDVEIKSSSSITLTSPQENVSIPPGIDLTLPPTFEVSSSNPTSPTLTGEKDSPNKFFEASRVWLICLIQLELLILCVKLVWGDPYPFIIID